jgi:hypothetical protein
MMSPKKNPLFAEADIAYFVAVDNMGTPLGRISATVHHDYNRRFGEDHAFFGFFECEQRSDVSKALFEAVERWAWSRDKRTLLGPYSYTSTQDAALLLENCNGQPPTLSFPRNPLRNKFALAGPTVHGVLQWQHQ